MPLTMTHTVEINTTLLTQNLSNVERAVAELYPSPLTQNEIDITPFISKVEQAVAELGKYHEPSPLECALDAIEEAKQAIAKLEDAAEIAEARQRLRQAICK